MSPALDLAAVGTLTFEEPDLDRFPCLAYAYDALRAGGSMPAVLSAANEVAVKYFLEEKIGYTDIARVIRSDDGRPYAVLHHDRGGRAQGGPLGAAGSGEDHCGSDRNAELRRWNHRNVHLKSPLLSVGELVQRLQRGRVSTGIIVDITVVSKEVLMTLIYFLIVIGILVFVHEFGHFIMAKRAGVRVEKFSLGMGPKLFGFKKGDTEYVLSALPLGGYVKMAGENPDEEPTGAPDEFQSKTVWQRAKIAATGPLTNIVLAFLVMPLVFMVGTYTLRARPGWGTWRKARRPSRRGSMAGDVIEKINGRSISDWDKGDDADRRQSGYGRAGHRSTGAVKERR